MKLILSYLLLLTVALSGCDRRQTQPSDESTTTDTTAVVGDADTVIAVDPPTPADTMPPAARGNDASTSTEDSGSAGSEERDAPGSTR